MNTQTLKNSYSFKIHSFIDLISNSSSEIFVVASEKTVNSVKEIVNNILAIGKSEYTCDDLFTVEIDEARFRKDSDDYERDENKTYKEWLANNDKYSEDYRRVRLLVKCKDTAHPLGKATEDLLSNLAGLFQIFGYHS